MSGKLPQYPQSYWLDFVELPSFPAVTEDVEADIVIVGGGITGITLAYLFVQENLKPVILEANRILYGTTGHTTAKITAQHGLIYDELIRNFDKDTARKYYEANEAALTLIKNIIKKRNIACDFSEEDAYIYTLEDESVPKLEKEWQAYQQLGIAGDLLKQTELPFQVKQALVMYNQAQFHPTKFLRALVEEIVEKGGRIFENSVATKVKGKEKPAVLLKNGKTVTGHFVISCSQFPFHDEGYYFSRMYQERSYVLACITEKDFPGGMYINAENPTRSIRSTPYRNGKLILFGGDHHKTGQGPPTIQHYENLYEFGNHTFGIQEVVYRWSAQDLSTLDKVPYIGYVTNTNRSVLVATGFRKWGMTTSMLAAMLLVDMVLNRENPYEEVFTPSRFEFDSSVKKFLQTNLDVAKHLIQGKIEKPKTTIEQLSFDEGAVVQLNGKRAGAYKDAQGKIYIVDTTCTHMGCELEWNSGDKSWDCPCHGSRFSVTGEVLTGPAEKPLKQLTINHQKGKP